MSGCCRVEVAAPWQRTHVDRENKTQHISPKAQRWGVQARPPDKVQVVASEELNAWLERKLATERTALVAKIQAKLDRQLVDHHKALLDEFESYLGSAFAARRSVLSEGGYMRDTWDTGSAPPFHKVVTQGSLEGEEENSDSLASDPSKCRQEAEREHYKNKRIAELANAGTCDLSSQAEVPILRRLVKSSRFEVMCSVLIILNTITMAAEVQYTGCDVAYSIGHPDCGKTATESWPGAALAFQIIPVVFTAIFFVEFLLRLAAMRWKALFSGWMWFDLVVLGLGVVDSVERMTNTTYASVNPGMMRTARIGRMMRMMKILKSREGFSSFFLLIKSLQASRQALLWSILLLFFTMTCVGMLMNQVIYSDLADTDLSLADQREVFDLFGTYTRLLITMFELTVGNWAPPSRLLMSKVNEWWGLFIVLYRCIFCFALVNVTAAVFITETTRVASSDDEVMMMRTQRTNQAHAQKLRMIFEELDDSGDGFVTPQEFQQLMRDDFMRQFLATMDVEVRELEELFTILDNGDGKVHAEEFIKGVQAIKGQAKSIDLLTLLKMTRMMDAKLDSLKTVLHVPTPRGKA